jgi:hypothetical protein
VDSKDKPTSYDEAMRIKRLKHGSEIVLQL